MKWLLKSLYSAGSLLFVSMVAHVLLPVFATASTITVDQYALQVIQKDLPRSLQWLQRLTALSARGQTQVAGSEAASENMAMDSSPPPAAPAAPPAPPAPPMEASVLVSQNNVALKLELQDLYTQALPVAQRNWHSGISVKGSIERILLLMEGARFFPVVQETSSEFQVKMTEVMRVLQAAKDQTDHFKFGEDPLVLFQQWQHVGLNNYPAFAANLEHVLNHLQQILAVPEQNVASTELVQTGDVMIDTASIDDEIPTSPEPSPLNYVAPQAIHPEYSLNSAQSFDVQRFFAYVEASEKGRVAPECEVARRWSTDSVARCENDAQAGCDRLYARQCKKLQ